MEGESIDLVAEEGKTKKKIKDINMKKYKNLQEYLSNTKVHLPYLTGVTRLWSLSKTHLFYLSTGSIQEDPSLFN